MDDDAMPHLHNDRAKIARVLFDDELKANYVRANATVVTVENGRFTIAIMSKIIVMQWRICRETGVTGGSPPTLSLEIYVLLMLYY